MKILLSFITAVLLTMGGAASAAVSNVAQTNPWPANGSINCSHITSYETMTAEKNTGANSTTYPYLVKFDWNLETTCSSYFYGAKWPWNASMRVAPIVTDTLQSNSTTSFDNHVRGIQNSAGAKLVPAGSAYNLKIKWTFDHFNFAYNNSCSGGNISQDMYGGNGVWDVIQSDDSHVGPNTGSMSFNNGYASNPIIYWTRATSTQARTCLKTKGSIVLEMAKVPTPGSYSAQFGLKMTDAKASGGYTENYGTGTLNVYGNVPDLSPDVPCAVSTHPDLASTGLQLKKDSSGNYWYVENYATSSSGTLTLGTRTNLTITASLDLGGRITRRDNNSPDWYLDISVNGTTYNLSNSNSSVTISGLSGNVSWKPTGRALGGTTKGFKLLNDAPLTIGLRCTR